MGLFRKRKGDKKLGVRKKGKLTIENKLCLQESCWGTLSAQAIFRKTFPVTQLSDVQKTLELWCKGTLIWFKLEEDVGVTHWIQPLIELTVDLGVTHVMLALQACRKEEACGVQRSWRLPADLKGKLGRPRDTCRDPCPWWYSLS